MLIFTSWVHSEKHLTKSLKSEQVYRSKSQTFIAKELAEGISYQVYSVYKILAGESEPELVVTGGLLKSSTWLGITADFFGKKLWTPKIEEASAWGGIIVGLRALAG
jgi:sugar (pentulose or hexulose) kinase